MNMRLAAAAFASIAAFAVVVVAGDAPKGGKHPHFDDKGALSWSVKLADAQAAAKSQDRLIFVEYGREA